MKTPPKNTTTWAYLGADAAKYWSEVAKDSKRSRDSVIRIILTRIAREPGYYERLIGGGRDA